MIEDGQPERVESQVDEDHDEEEGEAGAQQCDTPAVEEPAVDVACEEAGDEEAREEDARAEQGRADEVGGRGDEAGLHGAVHCTVDGDRQEAEGDAHKDRLDGKDIGEEYRQGHGDTGVDEWLDRESGHEKRPSFPLSYAYCCVQMGRSVAATRNVFRACSSGMQCLHRSQGLSSRCQLPVHPALNAQALTLLILLHRYL